MKILIAGCGYLGRQVALQLQARGHDVAGITRSENSAGVLAGDGIPAVVGDIGDAGFLTTLQPVDAIIHCAATVRGGGVEQYNHVYDEGCRQLLAFQPGARFIFTSSSSVYAQIDGSWVTEESPAEPSRPTGRILRQAEQRVLAAGQTVLRLAGLYGPDRSVLLRQFLLGEAQIDVRTDPPATPDGRWINQIHRDDAAAAIGWVVERPLPGLFNVADATPMTQRTIYTELAGRMGRPLPPAGPPDVDRKRGWSHKRVCSLKLAATGWSLRFPSWFSAFDRDLQFAPSILSQIAPHDRPVWSVETTPISPLYRPPPR